MGPAAPHNTRLQVNAVSETSVTLIEKLSLVELPEGLAPEKLVVKYVEVNEVDGSAIGAEKTKEVALNVSCKIKLSGRYDHL